MVRLELKLYLIQRLTGLLLAGFVSVHLALIIYASGTELDAAAILARSKGSIVWAAFYGSFVVTAAIHAATGVRNIALELTPLRPGLANALAAAFAIALVALGLNAVRAVT